MNFLRSNVCILQSRNLCIDTSKEKVLFELIEYARHTMLPRIYTQPWGHHRRGWQRTMSSYFYRASIWVSTLLWLRSDARKNNRTCTPNCRLAQAKEGRLLTVYGPRSAHEAEAQVAPPKQHQCKVPVVSEFVVWHSFLLAGVAFLKKIKTGPGGKRIPLSQQ